jgi:hypothetical protein
LRQSRSVNRVGDPQGQRHRPRPADWADLVSVPALSGLASDFFAADLLDGTQAYALAVIEHVSRRIRIIGVTLHPTGE